MAMTRAYDPATRAGLTFHDVVAAFRAGSDDPVAYLERCLATIAQREPVVRAWVVVNEAGAREAAARSAARWRAGAPLSPVDGMPIGIKDLIETRDLPTQMGCQAFAGNFPRRDSPLVRALREAGAVILGKVTTAELGGAYPPATTNPFDPRRTPGGSSSGSGAAVGADMVPVAIGTQVGGSVIRPASYCANWALKPTFGALNRGERLGYSHSVIGVHANSAADLWAVAMQIARRAGGDPGQPGLFGPLDTPPPVRPQRLVLMQTAGYASLDEATRAAFERVVAAVEALGVQVLRRSDAPEIERFEAALADAAAINADITAFEQRWSIANIADVNPDGLSRHSHRKLEKGRALSVDDYRRRLAERDDLRCRHAALAPLGDALLSLSSPGPAPVADPEAARPTGSAVFNYASSLLGAPAVTVPLLGIRGLPCGIQLMGQPHGDARVLGVGRWLADTVGPVSA